MQSGILTTGLGAGPKVTEFEKNYAAFAGIKHAIAVNTGTAALHAALLAVGVILLAFGLNAYHSASSDVSRFFTGAPTDKALWLLIGGAAAGIVGLLGLVRK